MKKLNLFFTLIVGILLAGCQQDLPMTDPQAEQDVVFNIGSGDKGLKSGNDCVLDADYALIKFKDVAEPVVLEIIVVNGMLYTETLKLPPGSYVLEELFLMKHGDPTDIVLSAAPHIGSEYANLVVNPVTIPFVVGSFEKKEINIDVLCFESAEFEEFGFTWFKINVITVKEGLFFGDHCSEIFEEYAGSKYGDYPKFDMPAIFKVDLYQNNDGDPDYETHIGTYNNFEDEDGNILLDEFDKPLYLNSEYAASVPPLSVSYIDRPDVEDKYKLVISVFQKTGNNFEYLASEPWYFTDDISLLVDHPGPVTGSSVTLGPGSDGIYDFISGPCIVSEFDININDQGIGSSNGETAFGYDDGKGVATCFFDIPDLGNQRWGWTNKYDADKNAKYKIPLYAGASHCDPNTKVGEFKFEVKNGEIKHMKFEMDRKYKLQDAHVYVGSTILPTLNSAYTVSPGQFTLKKDDLNNTDKYEFPDKLDLTADNFYIIAHATVTD
ncbi:MAG: hypothetical protein U9N86_07245 [Bacteroidota bacterium]|nr:hypothetical protein [Bacteroidota bacterium]